MCHSSLLCRCYDSACICICVWIVVMAMQQFDKKRCIAIFDQPPGDKKNKFNDPNKFLPNGVDRQAESQRLYIYIYIGLSIAFTFTKLDDGLFTW